MFFLRGSCGEGKEPFRKRNGFFGKGLFGNGVQSSLGGGFKYCFIFIPTWGNNPIQWPKPKLMRGMLKIPSLKVTVRP